MSSPKRKRGGGEEKREREREQRFKTCAVSLIGNDDDNINDYSVVYAMAHSRRLFQSFPLSSSALRSANKKKRKKLGNDRTGLLILFFPVLDRT